MPAEPPTESEATTEDIDDDDGEAMPLCISCMTPHDPSANFCSRCGAPIASLAAMGPFEHIFAEGFIYRQAAERPRSFVVVLGVWVLFGMLAVGGATMLFRGHDEGIAFVIIGLFWLALSIGMIWRTTRSYLARPRADEIADVAS
jgi:hypothetical protein